MDLPLLESRPLCFHHPFLSLSHALLHSVAKPSSAQFSFLTLDCPEEESLQDVLAQEEAGLRHWTLSHPQMHTTNQTLKTKESCLQLQKLPFLELSSFLPQHKDNSLNTTSSDSESQAHLSVKRLSKILQEQEQKVAARGLGDIERRLFMLDQKEDETFFEIAQRFRNVQLWQDQPHRDIQDKYHCVKYKLESKTRERQVVGDQPFQSSEPKQMTKLSSFLVDYAWEQKDWSAEGQLERLLNDKTGDPPESLVKTVESCLQMIKRGGSLRVVEAYLMVANEINLLKKLIPVPQTFLLTNSQSACESVFFREVVETFEDTKHGRIRCVERELRMVSFILDERQAIFVEDCPSMDRVEAICKWIAMEGFALYSRFWILVRRGPDSNPTLNALLCAAIRLCEKVSTVVRVVDDVAQVCKLVRHIVESETWLDHNDWGALICEPEEQAWMETETVHEKVLASLPTVNELMAFRFTRLMDEKQTSCNSRLSPLRWFFSIFNVQNGLEQST